MELMYKSGWNNKGVTGLQRNGAVVLPVFYTAAFHIADLVIIVPVGEGADIAVGHPVDMIFFPRGQMKPVKRYFPHDPTSFFLSLAHSEPGVNIFGKSARLPGGNAIEK